MNARVATLGLLVCAHAAAAPGPRAALVVAAAPTPDEPRLAAVRASLSARYQVIDRASVRAALEQFRRDRAPEEQVREALDRAHQRLRKFDLPALRQSLDEARIASGRLPPTPEGRALYAEVALREAEAASLAGDPMAAQRHMRLALAADGALALDPARHPPALVALCDRVRAELAAAPDISLHVLTVPEPARVYAGGSWRGETPLTLAGLKPGPMVIWLVHEGYRPQAARVEVPSAARSATMLPAFETVTLAPLDERARLQPLVDAVRRSSGEARRQAALALAAALEVSVVAVLDAGDAPVEYRREPPRTLDLRAEPAARRPWYKRGWVWGVVAGGVIAVAVVAGVAGYYGQKEEFSATCCR